MIACPGKPLAIDLFCGLGGWTEGLLAEGYDVIGYDIEAHEYGAGHKYPGTLVLQDVLTLHGSAFKDAALIVASPPCQEYSYMAMPWKRAKAKAAAIRADATGKDLERLNQLFNACFRLQREACIAAGRHIPMVVENVRGAQPWVGRSRWNFGSFYLWGDVPALMPTTLKASKVPGFRFDGSGGSFQTASVRETTGMKSQGMNWSDQSRRGQDFTRIAGRQAMDGRKNDGGSWFNIGSPGQKVTGQNPDGRKVPGMNWSDHGKPGYKSIRFNVTAAQRYREEQGTKQPGIGGKRKNGKGDAWFQDGAARHGSKSNSRKAASALIAKIPLPLARHIARVFKP